MIEFSTFAVQHPALTVLLTILGWLLADAALRLGWKLANRILRSANVALRGWPPPHLDADGDWKPAKQDGEVRP